MKHTPKKVFVLENGYYIEISYEKFCERIKTDEHYKTKWFIPLHGMLMEVKEDDYQRFYREEHHQRYLVRQEEKNGVVSYDNLTTEEFNGENILQDDSLSVEEVVEIKLMVEELKKNLAKLKTEDLKLIEAIYFKGMSEREWSAISGIPQTTISYQKRKLLRILKKSLEKF